MEAWKICDGSLRQCLCRVSVRVAFVMDILGLCHGSEVLRVLDFAVSSLAVVRGVEGKERHDQVFLK